MWWVIFEEDRREAERVEKCQTFTCYEPIDGHEFRLGDLLSICVQSEGVPVPRINISIPDRLADDLGGVALPTTVSRICQQALEEAVIEARGTAELVLTIPVGLAREIRDVPGAQDYCVRALQSLLVQLTDRHRTLAQVISDPAHADLLQGLLRLHETMRLVRRQLEAASVSLGVGRTEEAVALVTDAVGMIEQPPVEPADGVTPMSMSEFVDQLSAWTTLSPAFGAAPYEVFSRCLRERVDQGKVSLALALRRADQRKWVGSGSCFESKLAEATRSFQWLITDDRQRAVEGWVLHLEDVRCDMDPDGWEEELRRRPGSSAA